MFLGFKRGIWV